MVNRLFYHSITLCLYFDGGFHRFSRNGKIPICEMTKRRRKTKKLLATPVTSVLINEICTKIYKANKMEIKTQAKNRDNGIGLVWSN